MSTQAATATNVLGGWTPYEPLNAEDREIFEQATNKLVGVTYTPISVSKQIVKGTNYRFKCDASMPPSEVIWEAIVEIYKPLKGNPVITGIIRI